MCCEDDFRLFGTVMSVKIRGGVVGEDVGVVTVFGTSAERIFLVGRSGCFDLFVVALLLRFGSSSRASSGHVFSFPHHIYL